MIAKKLSGLPLLFTLLLTLYQLIRIIAFIQVYGGIEHDGGWMLSISRSLAEQGTYTTMVSTIADPNAPGGVGVDQKFDIQATDGRIWFFTGNGIGPASIIPDAVILKIFGFGFWALRAGPLIFYTLFLLLAAYILYQLAGLGAVVLFHAYLFCYPHISIFLSYEAMGEVPGMFYILLAYLVFGLVLQKRERSWLSFLGAGLAISLALNAKLITLWSISGIFIWAGMLWLVGRVEEWKAGRLVLSEVEGLEGWKSGKEASHRSNIANAHQVSFGALLSMVGGLVLPLILWEMTHLVILTHLTNFELYRQHLAQRIKFILDDGSGVGLQIHSGPEFFWDKFFILSEVAQPQRWATAMIFLAIFLGGLFFMWQWRKQPRRQNLLAPLWLGWLMNTIWFVSLAKTGWPRHFWFGLVLAIMLLTVISLGLLQLAMSGGRVEDWKIGRLITDYRLPITDHQSPITDYRSLVTDHWSLITGLLLLFLIVWGFVLQPHVWGFFLPDEIVPYWQEKQINHNYQASLPWIIIPRAAQAEVVEYIKQMPPEANVYYPGQHKSAEIPPQTGRVNYPFNRRDQIEPHPADIVLISPSLISPWKDPTQRRDLLNLVEQQCPRPALKNDFYMICPIADNLAQSK